MIMNAFCGGGRPGLLAMVLALAVLPAVSAEFVTTRATGWVRTGYPLEVPEGAFIELVQIGGYNQFVSNLKLRFVDGRVHENLLMWNRSHHGFKFAGVRRIEFTGSRDHVILWKITPPEEFGREGASYVTVIPGLPQLVAGAGYEVPEDHTVRILRNIPTGSDETEPNWASVRLDSSVPGLSAGGYIPTPSQAFPFLTDFLCDTLTLIEVVPEGSGEAVTLRVEQSDDFREWQPLRTFEVDASEAKRFFRTTIRR